MDVDLVVQTRDLKRHLLAGEANELKHEAEESGECALKHENRRFVLLATLAYSLAKLFEKPYIAESKQYREFVPRAASRLDKAVLALEKEDYKAYDAEMSGVLGDVKHLSQDLGRFVVNIIDKARIKAATQIYAHGASLGRAAELAGVDKRELSSYVGQTTLTEKYDTILAKDRLARARKLFN